MGGQLETGFIVAQIETKLWTIREQKHAEFRILPQVDRYLCFIDLAQSSNCRIIEGSKVGFIRTETFFSIIKEVIKPCPSVSLIKEIGDEVFIASDEFQPLLECVLLILAVAKKIETDAGTDRFPFRLRCVIGAGAVKKLNRQADDFLGTPIDQLARLMGVRVDDTNFLLHDTTDLFRPGNVEVLKAFESILRVAEHNEYISAEASKNMAAKVYYKRAYLDTDKLKNWRDNFMHWRSTGS